MVQATLAVTLGLDEVCSLEGQRLAAFTLDHGTLGAPMVDLPKLHLLNVVMLSDAHIARAMEDALTY